MLGYYENIQDNYGQPYCQARENRWCHPHFHNSIEVLYVLKGQIHVVLNGKSMTVNEGCFLVSPSYTIHYYQTEHYSYSYVLIIPTQSIPSYQALFSKQVFETCCCEDRSGGEMLHCLEELDRLAGDKSLERSLPQINMIKGYIYVLLSLMIRETGLVEYSETRDHSLARDICSYLQENYQSPLSLESLAQKFGYSKNRFSYIFHQYFGSGLPEYINMLRCKAAVDIMTNRKISVTEVAMQVGFESSRTFYRAFQRCYGMTPSRYVSRQAEKKAAADRPAALTGRAASE